MNLVPQGTRQGRPNRETTTEQVPQAFDELIEWLFDARGETFAQRLDILPNPLAGGTGHLR